MKIKVNLLSVVTYSKVQFNLHLKENRSLTIATRIMCLIYMISMHFLHKNSTNPSIHKKISGMQLLSIAFQVQDESPTLKLLNKIVCTAQIVL
jgi:hypothetical protein